MSTDVKIEVTPHPDEPLHLTEEEVDAGQAWLESRVADGTFTECKAYPQTGGFVRLIVPADDPNDIAAYIQEVFVSYPLNGTTDHKVDIVLPTLKEGFDTLRAAIRAGKRIGE